MKAVIFGRTQYEEQGNGTLVPVAEVEPNGQRHGLDAVSRAAALERIASRSTEWRVVDVMASDDYGVLAGPKGAGKTLALEDLAVSVSLGESWLGRFSTTQARVLLLTCEDPEGRTWSRIEAICRSKGRDPAELEGWLFVHPDPFNAVGGVSLLQAEIAETLPGLVVIDPAYKYLDGTRAQLFDMGPVLTPLQVTCTHAGASLLVGHHYNRREGVGRAERISGAGILEWARVVITLEASLSRDEATALTLEITGNSVAPVVLNLRRSVVALDAGPNPELSYSVEVLAEGTEAVTARYATAADRVLAVLPFMGAPGDDLGQGLDEGERLTVKAIGDLLAADSTGKGPLKADTIRKALNRDLKDRVDSFDGAWWRTS
jgi:AAA domain